MVKSLGIFLTSMADILASNDYDFIMLAGDRGEQLMGAIAGAYTYIPVGHIQAMKFQEILMVPQDMQLENLLMFICFK